MVILQPRSAGALSSAGARIVPVPENLPMPLNSAGFLNSAGAMNSAGGRNSAGILAYHTPPHRYRESTAVLHIKHRHHNLVKYL